MAKQNNPQDLGFVEAFEKFYLDNLQTMLVTESEVVKSKLNYEEVQCLYGEDP
jgi:hypothetical protein